MLKYTRLNGKPIFINPRFVVLVEPHDADTLIATVGGVIKILEPVDQVIKELSKPTIIEEVG